MSDDAKRALNRKHYKTYYEKHKETVKIRKRDDMRRYRGEDPEKHRERQRKTRKKLRDQIMDTYGAICADCGFSDIRALTVDHVLNNGAEERKLFGGNNMNIYKRALLPECRSEYQILCMNCQFIKHRRAGALARDTSASINMVP